LIGAMDQRRRHALDIEWRRLRQRDGPDSRNRANAVHQHLPGRWCNSPNWHHQRVLSIEAGIAMANRGFRAPEQDCPDQQHEAYRRQS